MLDFIMEYSSEIFLGLLMIILKIFGRQKSVEEIHAKLLAKKEKRRKKLEKKIAKRTEKTKEELDELEKLNKEY